MILLELDDLLLLHQIAIQQYGGAPEVRDKGLVESALLSTEAGFGEYSKYPTLEEKAARLCYSIVLNHGFVDGNKRTGAAAMLTMLKMNGVRLVYSQKELAELVLAVAAGDKGYNDLLNWIVDHMQ